MAPRLSEFAEALGLRLSPLRTRASDVNLPQGSELHRKKWLLCAVRDQLSGLRLTLSALNEPALLHSLSTLIASLDDRIAELRLACAADDHAPGS